MTHQLECLAADGDGLVVVFTREGDRYRHELLAVLGGKRRPLLRSVEGDAPRSKPPQGDAPGSRGGNGTEGTALTQDYWPSSPPLQQVSLEMRADGPVALAVGMAGKSHWSLSIEARCQQRELHFDVACRLPAAAGEAVLGSTYQWLEQPGALPLPPLVSPTTAGQAELASRPPPVVAWELGGRTLALGMDAGTRGEWLAEACWEIQPPTPAEFPSAPRTRRWGYRLTLA